MLRMHRPINAATQRLAAIHLFGDFETANRERPEGTPAFRNWKEVVAFIMTQQCGDPWYAYKPLFN
jgi:hypothetical protein